MAEVPITPVKGKLPPSEKSQIDDEEWAFMDDNKTVLFHEADGDDERDFGDAKEKGEQNQGYVYNVKDSTPARKGWFW